MSGPDEREFFDTLGAAESPSPGPRPADPRADRLARTGGATALSAGHPTTIAGGGRVAASGPRAYGG